jgi:hypothetical protein
MAYMYYISPWWYAIKIYYKSHLFIIQYSPIYKYLKINYFYNIKWFIIVKDVVMKQIELIY